MFENIDQKTGMEVVPCCSCEKCRAISISRQILVRAMMRIYDYATQGSQEVVKKVVPQISGEALEQTGYKTK